MNMTEIRTIAKKRNIRSGRMKKRDLIRTIQAEEGNVPCFQQAIEACDQHDCCWRSDCLSQKVH